MYTQYNEERGNSVMFQNSRLNELLKYFLAHREYTPSSKLTGHFQISERTLRGDVRAVND